MKAEKKILLALDTNNLERAEKLVLGLRDTIGGIKIGLELHTAVPDIIQRLRAQIPSDLEMFVDLKPYDIPRTTAGAGRALADLDCVSMFNVHVVGGRQMLTATMEALRGRITRPKVLGVTLLTSSSKEEFAEALGILPYLEGAELDFEQIALARAILAAECDLDGVVCGAPHVAAIRKAYPENFLIVVPGIRSPGASWKEQKLVRTPQEAIGDGASRLVIGSQVTDLPDIHIQYAELKSIAGQIHRGMITWLLKEAMRTGMVCFDFKEGFRVNAHKDFPKAPLSPFYVDWIMLRSFPELLDDVADMMVYMIKENGFQFDCIADIPTASTPFATLVAQKIGLPMISPRPEALRGYNKLYGRTDKEIDGVWKKGQKVVLIDDLVTTEKSKIAAVGVLERNGLEPVAICAILDRRNDETDTVATLPFRALTTWTGALGLYHDDGYIDDIGFEKCLTYPGLLGRYI